MKNIKDYRHPRVFYETRNSRFDYNCNKSLRVSNIYKNT